eukprot:1256430-Amphidinium_carterae.1
MVGTASCAKQFHFSVLIGLVLLCCIPVQQGISHLGRMCPKELIPTVQRGSEQFGPWGALQKSGMICLAPNCHQKEGVHALLDGGVSHNGSPATQSTLKGRCKRLYPRVRHSNLAFETTRLTCSPQASHFQDLDYIGATRLTVKTVTQITEASTPRSSISE